MTISHIIVPERSEIKFKNPIIGGSNGKRQKEERQKEKQKERVEEG